MSKLNEKTEQTKSVIHLMVTSMCLRDCPNCCNKQYSLDDVPYVTDEELKDCKMLCLTGGEPFAFTNPGQIAYYYKKKYSNIEKVIVYTNAYEFYYALIKNQKIAEHIDGVNISIKTQKDLTIAYYLSDIYNFTENDRIYDFTGSYIAPEGKPIKVIKRGWQEDFKAADDSIFRKV